MAELYPDAPRYSHVETGVYGIGANRKLRRQAKFKPRADRR